MWWMRPRKLLLRTHIPASTAIYGTGLKVLGKGYREFTERWHIDCADLAVKCPLYLREGHQRVLVPPCLFKKLSDNKLGLS